MTNSMSIRVANLSEISFELLCSMLEPTLFGDASYYSGDYDEDGQQLESHYTPNMFTVESREHVSKTLKKVGGGERRLNIPTIMNYHHGGISMTWVGDWNSVDTAFRTSNIKGDTIVTFDDESMLESFLETLASIDAHNFGFGEFPIQVIETVTPQEELLNRYVDSSEVKLFRSARSYGEYKGKRRNVIFRFDFSKDVNFNWFKDNESKFLPSPWESDDDDEMYELHFGVHTYSKDEALIAELLSWIPGLKEEYDLLIEAGYKPEVNLYDKEDTLHLDLVKM